MAAIRTRPLENLLKFKPKNKEKRKVLYKKLITALVQYERIETTINRCHDLSRVASRVRSDGSVHDSTASRMPITMTLVNSVNRLSVESPTLRCKRRSKM